MLNEQEMTRLLDDYVDGRLDEEGRRQLLALLEESAEFRNRVAITSLVQRLLVSAKLPPVTGGRVMQALRAGGIIPEQAPDTRAPHKIKAVTPRSEAPGRPELIRKRESWNQAVAAPRQVPLWIPVTILLVCLVSAAGYWWYMQNGGKYGQGPDVPAGLDGGAEVPVLPSPGGDQGGGLRPPVAGTNLDNVLLPRGGETDQVAFVVAPPPAQDLPESAFVDDSPAPTGDGSTEPGFVPPDSGGGAGTAKTPKDGSVKEGQPGTQPRNQPQVPVMFIKLDIGDPRYWNATPGDLEGLLLELKARARLSYRMEVRPLDQIKTDPEKNPILFLSGHYHFAFTPAQRAMLRKFMMAGGMMVFDTGLGSKPFYDSARRELRIIFRDVPLQRLGSDHPVFRSYFDLPRVHYGAGVLAVTRNPDDQEPWIEGVTIHCRTVAMLSRWGMAIGWEKRARDGQPAYTSEEAIRLGINLFSYAHALRGWAKQPSVTGAITDPFAAGKGDRLFVGQVRYEGEWNPRPSALPILLKTFNQRTAVPVRLGIKELRLSDPKIFDSPALYLTGHEGVKFSNDEVAMLRKYLESGGFLFAEACCGRRGFDQAFRAAMNRVLPDQRMVPIPRKNDVFSVPSVIKKVSVTPLLANLLGTTVIAPKLEGIELNGHYVVIYSPYGMAGSWEMTQSPYALGYNDTESLRLGQNILMYSLTH